MNRRVLSFAVLVGALLVGCGGAEVAPPVEELGHVSAAVVSCTATCSDGSSVSCTGATCSATNNSGVTCDGVTTACPPPVDTCTDQVSCEDLQGSPCAPRTKYECCAANGSRGSCACLQGGLICLP